MRSASMSLSSRPKPPRYSWMYWVRLECPLDWMWRSLPTQCGSDGSTFMTFWYSR